MLKFITDSVDIDEGAAARTREYIFLNYGGIKNILAVCDTNTESIAISEFNNFERHVFAGDSIADPVIAGALVEKIINKRALIAIGSGTVHDLTRFTAYKLNLPFISFPTAPSMDGFASGIAAMTVNGQKLTYPSAPPKALFAEPKIFMTAPRALSAAGVGDILGKFISLADWKISNLVTGERWDDEIAALELDTINKLLAADPDSSGFGLSLMQALVASGLAIQAYGNSRPASGAEHHLSHLWEMHCINPPTPALHGEKVGVSTLILLNLYKNLNKFMPFKKNYLKEYLFPAFGDLTDGIIKENLGDDPPDEIAAREFNNILNILRDLPDPELIKQYMQACGCVLDLKNIKLPDTPEFLAKTLEFALYVRKRVTLLRLCRLHGNII